MLLQFTCMKRIEPAPSPTARCLHRLSAAVRLHPSLRLALLVTRVVLLFLATVYKFELISAEICVNPLHHLQCRVDLTFPIDPHYYTATLEKRLSKVEASF